MSKNKVFWKVELMKIKISLFLNVFLFVSILVLSYQIYVNSGLCDPYKKSYLEAKIKHNKIDKIKEHQYLILRNLEDNDFKLKDHIKDSIESLEKGYKPNLRLLKKIRKINDHKCQELKKFYKELANEVFETDFFDLLSDDGLKKRNEEDKAYKAYQNYCRNKIEKLLPKLFPNPKPTLVFNYLKKSEETKEDLDECIRVENLGK